MPTTRGEWLACVYLFAINSGVAALVFAALLSR